MKMTIDRLQRIIKEEVGAHLLREELSAKKQTKLDTLEDKENKSTKDKQKIKNLKHQ